MPTLMATPPPAIYFVKLINFLFADQRLLRQREYYEK